MLNIINNAKSYFLGKSINNYKQRVIDDLRLGKTQGIVVDANVQDLGHVVAHGKRSGVHFVNKVVVMKHSLFLVLCKLFDGDLFEARRVVLLVQACFRTQHYL